MDDNLDDKNMICDNSNIYWELNYWVKAVSCRLESHWESATMEVPRWPIVQLVNYSRCSFHQLLHLNFTLYVDLLSKLLLTLCRPTCQLLQMLFSVTDTFLFHIKCRNYWPNQSITDICLFFFSSAATYIFISSLMVTLGRNYGLGDLLSNMSITEVEGKSKSFHRLLHFYFTSTLMEMYFHSDVKGFQEVEALHRGVWSSVCLGSWRKSSRRQNWHLFERGLLLSPFQSAIPLSHILNWMPGILRNLGVYRREGKGREVTLAEDGDAVLLPIAVHWDAAVMRELVRHCWWFARGGGSASGSSGKAGERSINSPSATAMQIQNTNTNTNTNTKYKYKQKYKMQIQQVHLAVLGKQEKGQSTLGVQFCNALCAVNCNLY